MNSKSEVAICPAIRLAPQALARVQLGLLISRQFEVTIKSSPAKDTHASLNSMTSPLQPAFDDMANLAMLLATTNRADLSTAGFATIVVAFSGHYTFV